LKRMSLSKLNLNLGSVLGKRIEVLLRGID
jgi:hypothetical protein